MQLSFEGSGSESAGLNQRGIVPMKAPIHSEFINKARRSALEGNHGEINTPEGEALTVDDLYVVWFAKTLQNWKALVSTDAVRGHYWEVTHNGDKKETYVDTYIKAGNEVIPDNYFDQIQ